MHYRWLHSLVSRCWSYVPHMTTDCVNLSHNVALIAHFMVHFRINSTNNTMGATWNAGKYKLREFPLVFCGVCIAQSLVFCLGGVDHYPFSLGYCIVCPLPIYVVYWPLSGLQTLGSGACVDWSLVFSIGLCWPLFALLLFDLWPLYGLPSISGFYVFCIFRLFLFPLCVRNLNYCPWQ